MLRLGKREWVQPRCDKDKPGSSSKIGEKLVENDIKKAEEGLPAHKFQNPFNLRHTSTIAFYYWVAADNVKITFCDPSAYFAALLQPTSSSFVV